MKNAYLLTYLNETLEQVDEIKVNNDFDFSDVYSLKNKYVAIGGNQTVVGELWTQQQIDLLKQSKEETKQLKKKLNSYKMIFNNNK